LGLVQCKNNIIEKALIPHLRAVAMHFQHYLKVNVKIIFDIKFGWSLPLLPKGESKGADVDELFPL